MVKKERGRPIQTSEFTKEKNQLGVDWRNHGKHFKCCLGEKMAKGIFIYQIKFYL